MRDADVAGPATACLSARLQRFLKFSSANNYEPVVLLLWLPLINVATRLLIGRQSFEAAAFWGGESGGLFNGVSPTLSPII